ncbi:MAG: response regulator [Gammaproteobacteria bacterium]|nr:response regulator [Gammaproteobacteria bacterium]
MKRILFVDDDDSVLDGIRNSLRRQRSRWDMTFALGGEKAVELMRSQPFEIVVTDMRMPGIDGAQLLTIAQAEFPHIVRIVLSGYSELEATMRTIPVAHQYLSKPCKPEILENVIERACNLQMLIADDSLKQTIGKIEKLPSVPDIYFKLNAMLADPDTMPKHVAHVLEQDMAMCAKILQIVNSAFFRIARKITSVEEAVAYLGFNTIRNLALSTKVFEDARNHPNINGLDLGALQRHALLSASIARAICTDRHLGEDAFVAGMLHDIGILILALEYPEQLNQAITAAQTNKTTLEQAEEDLFGATHEVLGAYLLDLWGLPYPIIEAVANHHHPDRVASDQFDVLTALYVGHHFASKINNYPLETLGSGEYELNEEYLRNVGVINQLDRWQEVAKTQSEQMESVA